MVNKLTSALWESVEAPEIAEDLRIWVSVSNPRPSGGEPLQSGQDRSQHRDGASSLSGLAKQKFGQFLAMLGGVLAAQVNEDASEVAIKQDVAR